MTAIRTASEADIPAIRAILVECGLPEDDFGKDVSFLAAESDGSIVATIGLESYPPVGLLRSAAVLPSHRGSGIGGELVEAVVREARRRALREIVLLTTTAEAFFARRGFSRIDRSRVTGPVLDSGQFQGNRCASAAVMRMTLGERDGGAKRSG